MKYFILATGIISICLVTIINFFPKETKEFITKIFNNEEYIIAIANDYYLEGDFDYLKTGLMMFQINKNY